MMTSRFRLTCWLSCWFVVAAVAEADAALPASSVPEWRRTARCGTNALYVLAKLSGAAVTYDDVAKSVNVGRHGSSVEDLRVSAEQLGLTVRVRNISAEEFLEVPCPFILHLDYADQGGGGHFVTVDRSFPDKEDGTVYFVDGTTGLETQASVGKLKAMMSGVVLVPENSVRVGGTFDWPLLLLVGLVSAEAIVLWVLMKR